MQTVKINIIMKLQQKNTVYMILMPPQYSNSTVTLCFENDGKNIFETSDHC